MNKFLFTSLIILCTFSFAPKVSNALVAPLAFGGKVVASIPCMCNGGLMITVLHPVTKLPIQIMVQPFISRINMNFSFIFGNSVLGTYIPTPIPCLNGILCLPTGTSIGFVTTLPFSGVGTSLLPSPNL